MVLFFTDCLRKSKQINAQLDTTCTYVLLRGRWQERRHHVVGVAIYVGSSTVCLVVIAEAANSTRARVGHGTRGLCAVCEGGTKQPCLRIGCAKP